MNIFLSLLLGTLIFSGCTGDEGNQNNCIGPCEEPLKDVSVSETFGPAEPSDWAMYRADSERTGYAPESVVGDTVSLVWQKESFHGNTWTAVKPSGAVWGDVLYYPSDFGTLYAFDRMTGDELWRNELIGRRPGIHGTPLVTKATVCIGTYLGLLHCLEPKTGEERWSYKIGNVIGSSPAYVESHNAIYISHEAPKPKDDSAPGAGFVTKNDPRDGEEIWRSEALGHWPHSSVSVDAERKIVVVGANDGVLYAFDSDDGKTLWTLSLDGGGSSAIKTTPTIASKEGLVLFGAWDGKLHAVDIKTGKEKWTAEIGGSMQGSAALDVENSVVYQGGPGSKTMHAINVADGSTKWALEGDKNLGKISSSPAISGDRKRIVFGTNDNKVVALNAETGDLIWTFDTDGPVSPSPVLVKNMIYIAARDGSLYALETK